MDLFSSVLISKSCMRLDQFYSESNAILGKASLNFVYILDFLQREHRRRQISTETHRKIVSPKMCHARFSANPPASGFREHCATLSGLLEIRLAASCAPQIYSRVIYICVCMCIICVSGWKKNRQRGSSEFLSRLRLMMPLIADFFLKLLRPH